MNDPRARPGDGESLADSCDDLERTLGPFGFQWLCACAVYPELRFPLTVHLGRQLAQSRDRRPPDEDEHLALFRLHWFRRGWLPDELRFALIRRQWPELRPVVRAAIEDVLFAALEDNPRDDGAAPGLKFLRPPRTWRGALRGFMDAVAPGAPEHDVIFIHYMTGRVPSALDLRLNRMLTRLIGARAAGWLDTRTLAFIFAAFVLTGGTWWVSDVLLRPALIGSQAELVAAPQMVALPGGTFVMGSPEGEEGRMEREGPQRGVTIRPFAIGAYEVTFDEWEACVADGGCNVYRPGDAGWGRGRRPVINVSWDDAKAYVAWLSEKTGLAYRLPTEAEWEYAARAGTTMRYWWGEDIDASRVSYGDDVGKTTEVGSYPANPFGLHDMHGNVWEWVEDCWHDSYEGAPVDGSAWDEKDCSLRVLRGGSWNFDPRDIRSASRISSYRALRYVSFGFRVARTPFLPES